MERRSAAGACMNSNISCSDYNYLSNEIGVDFGKYERGSYRFRVAGMTCRMPPPVEASISPAAESRIPMPAVFSSQLEGPRLIMNLAFISCAGSEGEHRDANGP